MSHIVRGKIDIAYREKEFLVKALQPLGKVLENETISIALGGDRHKASSKCYALVLQHPTRSDYRMGFADESGVYIPYCDEWGGLGDWVRATNSKIKDRYLAFHYERQLIEEGFEVSINEQRDGTLEVVGSEAVW